MSIIYNKYIFQVINTDGTKVSMLINKFIEKIKKQIYLYNNFLYKKFGIRKFNSTSFIFNLLLFFM